MTLSQDRLDSLPADVGRPGYPRSEVTPGIVHFGVGGFHRAHQAMYLDELMNQGVAMDWGIVGVGTMPGDSRMRDALVSQDCLYTLVVKHPDGRRDARVIGSIIDYLFAPDDPERVLRQLTDPAIRIVSLTVTEGGYHINQTTGAFDPDDPDLQFDIENPSAPRTVFGFIVEALRRRRDSGVPPFAVMSCDNLPGNGNIARSSITAFAERVDAELAGWIAEAVAFPNCMVDRITPVTVPEDIAALEAAGVVDAWPVVCEPYRQWVLEDEFGLGRPPLEDVGVQLVTDVVPYELMKLRLLNAGHQAFAYLGTLAGYRFAHEVCQDPLFARFTLGYMEDEASPTLPALPGIDLDAYRHQLIERFGNPYVRDTLARLAAETSDRIPKFIVPVIVENLDRGRPIARAALVIASWARYAEGVDERGEPIEVVDRLKDQMMAAAAAQSSDELAFVRDRALFGDLADRSEFAEAYVAALRSLHEVGARSTVAALDHSEPRR